MKLTGVQMLRFAAAMLVVVMHVTQAISVHVTGQGGEVYWAQGSAGVDIFFVISGLVMGLSTPASVADAAGRARQAAVFMARRLLRIVPLYWFYTLLKVALLAALPAMASRFSFDGEHLAASLLFVPWTSPWGDIQPVLPVGWTLNFEMLFYALFALALLLGAPRLLLCLGVFGALVGAAHLWELTALEFYGQSIVMEFVLGLALAQWHRRRPSVPPEVGLLALSLGLVWMFGMPWGPGDDRFVSWGLGAGLIVAGALWLEPWAARLPGARAWAHLGDASYSLYLSHTFVVPAGVLASRHLGLADPGAMVLAVAVLATACGSLSYTLLERPATRWLQRRLTPGTRRAAPSSGVLSPAPDRVTETPAAGSPDRGQAVTGSAVAGTVFTAAPDAAATAAAAPPPAGASALAPPHPPTHHAP